MSPLVGSDAGHSGPAADGGAATGPQPVAHQAPSAPAGRDGGPRTGVDLPVAATAGQGRHWTPTSATSAPAGSGPDVQRQVVPVDPGTAVRADGTLAPPSAPSAPVGPSRPRRSRIGEPLTGPVDVQRLGAGLPEATPGTRPFRGQSDDGERTPAQPAGPRSELPLQRSAPLVAPPAAPTPPAGPRGDGPAPVPAVDRSTASTTGDGAAPTPSPLDPGSTPTTGPDELGPASAAAAASAGEREAPVVVAPLTAGRPLLPEPGPPALPGTPEELHLPGRTGTPDGGPGVLPAVQRSVPDLPTVAQPRTDEPAGAPTTPAPLTPAPLPPAPLVPSGRVTPQSAAQAAPHSVPGGHPVTSGHDSAVATGPAAPVVQRAADPEGPTAPAPEPAASGTDTLVPAAATAPQPAPAPAGHEEDPPPAPAAQQDEPEAAPLPEAIAPLLGERPGLGSGLGSGAPAPAWSAAPVVQRSPDGTVPGAALAAGTASRPAPGRTGGTDGTVGPDPQVRLVPLQRDRTGSGAAAPAGTVQRSTRPSGTAATAEADQPPPGPGSLPWPGAVPHAGWTGTAPRSLPPTGPGAAPTVPGWDTSGPDAAPAVQGSGTRFGGGPGELARPFPAGPVAQRAPDPGSTALALGLARRDVDGSVVFVPPRVQRDEDPAGEPLGTQPAADGPAPAGTPVGPDPAGTAGPPPTPVPAAAAPAGPAPAATAGTPDLDDLARRLFDPLSARLRAELRLDRERAGLAADLRH
ncbi:hypothetical protein [Modestobacter sp. URMC 112]